MRVIMSRYYDNWERLVAAVLDREKLREIARAPSLSSSSFSSGTSDNSFYSIENFPELGDLNQMNISATKARLVRCPTCLEVLVELPDVTLYQCGGCGTTLQAKTRKLNTNNAELSSQETDSDDADSNSDSEAESEQDSALGEKEASPPETKSSTNKDNKSRLAQSYCWCLQGTEETGKIKILAENIAISA